VTAGLTAFFVWNEFLLAQTPRSPKVHCPGGGRELHRARKSRSRWARLGRPVVITIPLVLAVILFQKRIVAGLTAGAVKG
jgi:multiple sugar transport system permease protein